MAKQYKTFTVKSAGEIRVEIDKVLAQLEQFGIKASIGNIIVDLATNEIRTKLTVKSNAKQKIGTARVATPGSTAKLNDKDLFATLSGTKVELNDGKLYSLVDFKPRNRKYPFIIEGPQGGRYKVARSQLVIK